MAETLKPCPCCGGEANVRFYGDPHCTVVSVVCDECGLGTTTVVLDDYLSAVNAWNHRAERTCEIVRCKDCEWFKEGVVAGKLGKLSNQCLRPTYSGERLELSPEPDDFCSWGERRVVE